MADPRYDVFLSHNSKDKPAVERIAESLRAIGLEPWLDKWHLAPGRSFQVGIDAGLRGSLACAVFHGPHGPGAWQKAELEVAQDRAVKDPDFRLFLVLLPGVPEPFDASTLPAFLNMRTWVDLRSGYTDPHRLQPLVNAIAGIPLGPTPVLPGDPATPPYRGLDVFDEVHAADFFGREADVQRLLEQLKGSRFLAVVGASGSGKSSLVRAGLVPTLRNGALPGSHDWPIRIFTPGARPLDALAAQLVQLDPTGRRSMGRTLDELQDSPRTLDFAATLLLDGRPHTDKLVLVVDQFEELFTLCHSEDDRRGFLDNLLHAATVPAGRCIIIVTLRADFYSRCAAYPPLATVMARHQALVGPLGERGLRSVIVEPARRVGLTFEPGLVETIMGEVGTEPGSLPLLEHALLELWERRQGTLLTLAGYRDSGGVTRALANRADAVYLGLTAPEQAVARRVMLRLTQPGEQTEDTRRRASLAELVTRPEEAGAVTAVVDQLVAARLLTTSQADVDGEPQVEVAHEALIRAWPRLRGWLDENRDALLAHSRLTEATEEWERLGRDPDGLYRGARLTEALQLAAQQPELLNAAERAFIAASVARRDADLASEAARRTAQERQRRAVVIGLSAFSLLALILAGLALWQANTAGRNQALAFQAQATSEAERVRADGEAAAAIAAHATSEAERVRADQEAAAAIAAQATAVAQSTSAAQGRNSALSGAFNANVARATAVAARDTADVARATAEAARIEAETQTRVTRSRLLAAQSQTVRSASLAMLLGLEATRLDPDAAATRGSLLSALARFPHLRAMIPAHAQMVVGLAFSPDGREFTTTGADGIVQRWESVTLTPLGPALAVGEGGGVFAGVGYRPDGNQIAVSGDYGVILFDLMAPDPAASGTVIAQDQPWFVYDLAYSPDGARLAFSTDQGLVLWDIAANAPDGDVMPAIQGSFALAYSPDGDHVALGDIERIEVWDLATRELAYDPIASTLIPIYDLAYSPDGALLAAAGSPGAIEFWDAVTGQADGEPITVPDEVVSGIAFEATGDRLAAVGAGSTVTVFDVDDRAIVAGPWSGQDAFLTTVSFQPGADTLISGGQDGTLASWGLSAATTLSHSISLPDETVRGVAYRPDGARLALGTDDGDLFEWDLATDQRVGDTVTIAGPIWSVVYLDDGAGIAIAAESGTYYWSLATPGATPERLATKITNAQSVSVNADGQYLASSGREGISIWHWPDRTPLHTIETSGDADTGPTTVAVSPDGRYLVGTDGAGQVSIWDLVAGERVYTFDPLLVTATLGIDFNATSDAVVLSSLDGTALVSRVPDGELIWGPERVVEGIIWAIRFTPDDRELTVVDVDGGIILYSIAQQAQIGNSLTADGQVARVLRYSPDGTTLAAGGAGGVNFWDVRLATWQRTACAIVRQNLTPEQWSVHMGDAPYAATCPDYPLPPVPLAAPSFPASTPAPDGTPVR